MTREIESLKRELRLTTGISPAWLLRCFDAGWLRACIRLAKAGVLTVTEAGVDFDRRSPLLGRYAHELAEVISMFPGTAIR